MMATESAATTEAAPSTSTIYVDDGANGINDGTSWSNAYNHLQDALSTAADGDEIWVAEGIYYPDEGRANTSNALTETFTLKSGVAVYGGFDGSENDVGGRDWRANITVLSGDIEQDDTTDSSGVVVDPAAIVGDNSYHVVTSSGMSNTVELN
jgi:hypothetical protein